ncbi:hypothetical protein [Carboxylicivirga sp. M1479]|nr:hypothetical protein [Carboxylicivirga sp. M1479]
MIFLGKAKKQGQFKKFNAKDTAFLKKIIGGDDSSKDEKSGTDNTIKI